MVEFVIGEHTYRTRKLNAFQQLHVARKVLPLLSAVVKASDQNVVDQIKQARGATATADDAPSTSNESIARIMEIVSKAVNDLPEEDLDFIVKTCMGSLLLKQDRGWAAIYNEDAEDFQFDFITLPLMLQLTFRVIQENLGDFFPEGALTSSEPR